MTETHAAIPDDLPGRRPPAAIGGGLALLGCLLALGIACRNGMPGVPVSDDFLILAHQRFGRFDWLDAHGLDWYWRPASRQLYYLLLGPTLTSAPWVAASVHAMLLALTFAGLWSLARRFLPARGALVVAAFPLLVEPARTLLAWPSAAQHLIAMAGVAVAAAAAARGWLLRSLACAALAITSIESAALVLPLLPLLARQPRARWLFGVTALGGAWLALRLVASTHGSAVPAGIASSSVARIPAALARSLAAQIGVEDLPPAMAFAVILAYAALVAACVWSARRSGASPSRADRGLVAGGLAWWLAGSLPLAGVPDWNAWRSSLPGLGLGLALGVLVARRRPWAAASFLAVRTAALLLATPAPAGVSSEPPPSRSQLSYPRLVRLQRTLHSTRLALSAPPGLARGARVRYWSFPRLTEVGFGGPAALRVWFDDPTLAWESFGGGAGFADLDAVVVAYDPASPRLAVRLSPEAQRALRDADAAVAAGDLAAGDAHLARALALQREPVGRLSAVVYGNRATLQLRLGSPARADSLHRLGFGLVPEPEWRRTEVAVALALADTARARAGVGDALRLAPADPGLLDLSRALAAR